MSNLNVLFFNTSSKFVQTLIDMLVRPYERCDCCDRYISGRNNTSARSFSSTTLSRPQSNFLHQTCVTGHVKTLVTIYWTHLRVNGLWTNSFCPQKTNNRRCSLQDAFSSNAAIFIVYKWCHSDVTVINLTSVTQN